MADIGSAHGKAGLSTERAQFATEQQQRLKTNKKVPVPNIVGQR